MAIKIEKKIKGFSVQKPDDAAAPSSATAPAVVAPEATVKSEKVVRMSEQVERPDVLIGSTYKIKSPLFEHALYVTLNDIVLNQGTAHELRRPFEIFINSKNMDHFQWIVALTRIMSAVFRKGGDVTFLVEEMRAVFDPRGGYFKAGGVYMPSIVAEIGAVVEAHMKMIGLIHDPELSDAARQLIAEKRAAFDIRAKKVADTGSANANSPASAPAEVGFPASASLCGKCSTKAVILMDGCATCLNCGNSKCG